MGGALFLTRTPAIGTFIREQAPSGKCASCQSRLYGKSRHCPRLVAALATNPPKHQTKTPNIETPNSASNHTFSHVAHSLQAHFRARSRSLHSSPDQTILFNDRQRQRTQTPRNFSVPLGTARGRCSWAPPVAPAPRSNTANASLYPFAESRQRHAENRLRI